MDIVLIAFIASFLAGIATSVGAIPVFFVNKITEKFEDTSLGFAAGVMLAASFFSLIIPGLDFATEMYNDEEISLAVVLGGLIIGAISIWIFIIAITLHNMPEGLAVGVGFGGGNIDNGKSLAIGIGLQNIPEGMAVAFSLVSVGYSRLKSFVIATITGLFEPLFGFLGASLVVTFQHLLPWGLGFAAGAMLFVISHEIIPETHRRGHENYATAGFLVGLVVMMALDILLG